MKDHTENKWKRAAAVLTVLAVSLQAPAAALAANPEFARTPEEWERLRDDVLEYDEIEDLITEYNTTVQNNLEDWRKNSSGKTAKQFVNDARKAVDDLYMASVNADDDMTMITNDMQARLAENEIQRTIDSAEDGETRRLQNLLTEKQLAVQAQTLMNTYFQLQCQLENAQTNRELLVSLLEVAQRQQSAEVGMATYSEVLTAQQNLQNADAQIISLQNEIESTRQKLIVMLGWKQDANPEIRPVPEADPNRIAAMNPQADFETACTNDYTLRIDQRKESNSITDSGRKTHTVNIEQDKQQIAVALNSAYQAVVQAKNSYDQARMDTDIADRDYQTAQLKQQVGMGTALETLQAEKAAASARIQEKLTDYQLLQAMETYDWILKGVRS